MPPGMAAVWAIGRPETRQAVRFAAVDVVVGGNRSSGPNVANYGAGELLEIDRHAMPIPNPFMMSPMSIFGFARITFLVSGVLAFAATVAAQATPLDPARLVASIYADGREGVVWAEWLERAARGMVFALADGAMGAVRRPRSQRGDGLGAIDFDVATNSQGLEVRRFTVKTLSRSERGSRKRLLGS